MNAEQREHAARKIFLTIIAAIFFALILSALQGCAARGASSGTKASTTPNAVAISDLSPMSPEQFAQFLRDYDEYKKLSAEIAEAQRKTAERMQPTVDLAFGIQERLRAQVPAGFNFDPAKRIFVRLPQPTAPSPAPAAAPPQPTTGNPSTTIPPSPASPAPAAEAPKPEDAK